MSTQTQTFLVSHDYGQGGLWWWITACSADEITSAYKDIRVYERVPTWWSDDQNRITPRIKVSDPDDALKALAKDK